MHAIRCISTSISDTRTILTSSRSMAEMCVIGIERRISLKSLDPRAIWPGVEWWGRLPKVVGSGSWERLQRAQRLMMAARMSDGEDKSISELAVSWAVRTASETRTCTVCIGWPGC
jgi:hypothetical protein